MDHGCCPANLHCFKPLYSGRFHSPHSPTGASCYTLAQGWVTSKCSHSDLICLIQCHFAEKKKSHIQLVDQPSALNWGVGYGEASQIPKSSMSTETLTNPWLHWHHQLQPRCSVPQHCCHDSSLAVIKALVFQSEVLLVRPSIL